MRPTDVLTTTLLGSFMVLGVLTPCVGADGFADLKIGNGDNWHFLGGKWAEDDTGVTHPPDKRNRHCRAFNTATGYRNLTAEFEFNSNYRENGHGGCGLAFGARGPNDFYMVYFPWGGQQLRAKHFWVQVIEVSGDGYLRAMKTVWIPGVVAEIDRWYKVRLEVKGATVSVTVDGRHALTLKNLRFERSGGIGLAGYGWYFFRNMKIAGQETSLAQWDREAKIPKHSFEIKFDIEKMPKKKIAMASAVIAPNGDVLLMSGNQIVRSTDKGRTWGKPVFLPVKVAEHKTYYGNTIFCTSKGRLVIQGWRTRETTGTDVPEVLISESKDSGVTWSDPVASVAAKGWPTQPWRLTPYGPLTETEDGSLLRFVLGTVKEERLFGNIYAWSGAHIKAYAVRSTDGGKNWSAPIELDRPMFANKKRGSLPGALDFTEPTGVAIGDKVTVLIRPIHSQMMWQCWSDDSGENWDACAWTTFPGYAQSMVRLNSGAILCAHRYPHYSINVSYDDALNWDEGTIIDYPSWAMGCLLEVEPDVVLCTYMNAWQHHPLLAQLIRVTPNGIEPIDRSKESTLTNNRDQAQ